MILQTERLLLREMSLDDLDFLAEMLGHPEVMRYWPRPHTRDEAVAWIERQLQRYADDGCGYWLAIDRASGRPVGQAGVMQIEVDGVAEPALGYILHRPYWGRGLALEAARGCLEWAFAQPGCERVVCLVRPENVPSLRVAIRLGLLPEKLTTHAELTHLVFAGRCG